MAQWLSTRAPAWYCIGMSGSVITAVDLIRGIGRLAGLEIVHLWGGTTGNWGRRPLDLDEMEIMLVARKPA